MFHNGIWGTVCNDDWDIKDANVVCSQLGFVKAVETPSFYVYGTGSGQIWLDHVNCVGDESSQSVSVIITSGEHMTALTLRMQM